MSIEQHFAAAINADPDDRVTQLVYADWLDEQGDPRAEAWRMLIEAGKRPEKLKNRDLWCWWREMKPVHAVIGTSMVKAMEDVFGYGANHKMESFFAAMNAAAIAWVRCHRDAGYEPDELTERV